MYSTEDLTDLIKEHIAKLDLNWFNKKEREFKANEYYDLMKDAIYHIEKHGEPMYQDMGWNEDTGEELGKEIIGIDVQEEIINIDLREYCSCYLPIDEITHWGDTEYMDNNGRVDLSNNIDEVAYDLVKETSDFLKDEKDNVTVHKFINKVLDAIGAEVKLCKKEPGVNDIYNYVLDDFLKLCTSKMYRKYERQLTLYNETVDYKGQLEFDLNQYELLALLFVIQRAGFLNYTDNTPFLRFCAEHFLYKNRQGEMVKPDFKNLQKKYSNISASIAKTSKQDIPPTALSYIIEELKKSFQKL